MIEKKKTIRHRTQGQAITEFALALPFLLLAVFGLLEVGRAVFMYAAVTNASREAVRYATAYGVNETNVLHYQNCAEIRNEARRVAFLVPLADDDINISYDTGPQLVDPNGTPDDGDEYFDPPTVLDTCNAFEGDATNGVDTSVTLACGDRVVVTVTLNYHPMVSYVPVQDQTFTTSSARTYVGIVKLVDNVEDMEECK